MTTNTSYGKCRACGRENNTGLTQGCCGTWVRPDYIGRLYKVKVISEQHIIIQAVNEADATRRAIAAINETLFIECAKAECLGEFNEGSKNHD